MANLDGQSHNPNLTEILNRAINSPDINVRTSIKNDCLQVTLESEKILDEKFLTEIIRQELTRLNLKFIRVVKVCKRERNQDFLDWNREFYLGSSSLKEIPEQSEFLATLRTFKFASVVPYKDAFNAKLYSSNNVKLLLFFALFPLAISLLVGTAGLEEVVWVLGIYYSSIWGLFLYNLIKPPYFAWSDIFKCITFTGFIGTSLLLFAYNFPPLSTLFAATQETGIIRLIGFVLGVGLPEETCKGLPIYLFLLRTGKLKDPLTSAFYAAMSGLGFAIAEGVEYSFRYAVGLTMEGPSSQAFGIYVLSNTIRFVSLPLFHAIWAGIVGYFLGLASINRSRQTSIIFIGVSISAVLHGLYDAFSSSIIGFGILTFSILLFVAYLRRSEQMVAEMLQAELDHQNQGR